MVEIFLNSFHGLPLLLWELGNSRCARGMLPSWQDLAVLQDKLRISTKKLEEYETLFKCQEETTQKLVLEYQARLEEGEERLRRQQEDKDIQMKGIISR